MCIYDVMTKPVNYVHCSVVSDVNLALNQPTYAVSVRTDSLNCNGPCSPRRVVDGNRSPQVDKSFATTKTYNPWFAVQLLNNDVIAKVVITNKIVYGKNGMQEVASVM